MKFDIEEYKSVRDFIINTKCIIFMCVDLTRAVTSDSGHNNPLNKYAANTAHLNT
jgi:hypothetical protein